MNLSVFVVFCLTVLLPNWMSKLIHSRCKLGADPGFFLIGGSKLWFREDCWTLFTWFLLVKDAPLEHPPLVFGYKNCTDFVNINVKVIM